MTHTGLDYEVFVISAGRPSNNLPMHKALGAQRMTWIVPKDEYGEYCQYAGTDEVIVGGNLMDSRNLALDIAQSHDNACLQLSDDLKALRYTDSKINAERRFIDLDDAVQIMLKAMSVYNARLAGVAPTDNAFFYNHPVSTNLFIVGDMILVHPESKLRFDTSLTLKEDYDFTLQHLAAYGVVARCNQILASFTHRSNRGGAVRYRTPQREQENIAYLKRKWPNHIVDNARRENEVLLKWKG